MAYTNFQNCTASEYKNIVYNQETNNKIKILFNNVELEDADEYCESFEVVSRVIPNGSKIFMLENLVSQEATLVLHNIDTSIIQDQVSISIGTLVSENTYEYVPIGIYNLQEIPTTDNGKTTIKLRDNSVKLDFNYNAKPLIDEHGGTATKLQILQDICTKAGITCNVSTFIGSSDLIGIYDNTITGRQYVAYLAGSAGAIPIITRTGALDFKYINSLSTIEIPIEIVEKYSNAENFKISRVVYEDAIRKYEHGSETYDTLFLDSANPYISSQSQVDSIYNIVNDFEINSFTTGNILGNPAIDSYDLIQITDYDGTIFKTFANNTLRYNGKMINTFASEISFERKKENVSLKSGATFKKWAKTEIDNANAQITIQAGQIEEIQTDISTPNQRVSGTYIDIDNALDEPLVDFSIDGDTYQNTTTGKNLLKPKNVSTTTGGITASYDATTQTFTFNGTCTADNTSFSLSVNNTIPMIAGTTKSYAFWVGGSVTNYCTMRHFNSNYSKGQGYSLLNLSSSNPVAFITLSQTFDCPPDKSSIRFDSGSVANNLKVRFMVTNEGNDDYEPYTYGASPNPNWEQPIESVTGRNTLFVCGKNIFSSDLEQGTINGTTGLPSNVTTTRLRTINYISVLPNTQYTLSINETNKTIYVFEYDGNYNFIQRIPSSWIELPYTFTTSNITKNIKIVFRNNDDSDISPPNVTNRQLELGTQTTYEPYQGISQEINLGKNLFNINQSEVSVLYATITINGNELTQKNSSTDAYSQSNWFIYNLIVGETYHVNCEFTNTNGCTLRLNMYDRNDTLINRTDNTTATSGTLSLTFVATDTTCKMRLYSNNTSTANSYSVIFNNIQLEKGSQETAYSNYFEPIKLNKIGNYQDYLFFNEESSPYYNIELQKNRWYIHKEIGEVALGNDDTWVAQTSSNTTVLFVSENATSLFSLANYTTNYKMTHFTTNTATYSSDTIGSYVFNNQLRCRILNTIASTSGDFKTWLSNNNVKIIGTLATPTDTEITADNYEELYAQLNNLLQTPILKGINHIGIDTENLQPNFNIEYVRDTALNDNFVKRPELNNYYTKTETTAQIQIDNASIKQDVAELQVTVDNDGNAISTLSNQVSTLQTSTDYLITVTNDIEQNGVTKVQTSMGYKFDNDGLNVSRSGSTINTLIDNNGLTVNENTTPILFAGYNTDTSKVEVRSPDLISERATIGKHRCETYTENSEAKTGWFYVG